MPGVVGGVSGRQLDAGQAPVHYPDLLSAQTTLLQSGGGGFARLVNALQSLDQTVNIATLAATVGTNTTDITALQGQVATLQGQVSSLTGRVALLENRASTLESQVATLQGQVSTLQGQVAAQQVTINSFNYMQFEVSTGTLFLDQRAIYKRSFVINGALETALNVFTYGHGVPAINYIVNIQAMAGAATAQQFPITFLNMATAPSLSTGLSIWADANNIYVSVGTTTFPGIQVLATMWYTATNR